MSATASLGQLWRKAEKAQWRAWYSLLAWYAASKRVEFACMNWGYDDGRVLVPEHFGPERLPLQLYAAVSEGLELSGKTVLDASCGRGGGLAYLREALALERGIGVDFTPAHVALCRRTVGARDPRLEFLDGDAERMPVPSASVDAVLSVEASHCYADIERFLREADRVLRPGGVLAWTDFAPTARAQALEQLARGRFEVARSEDITAHVLTAMRGDRDRRQALVSNGARLLRPVLIHFAAADEKSETVTRFLDGSYKYFLLQLRKHG